jgi:phosphoribosylanthranilate isomerase
MSLRVPVFISSVNNLSDARYCAGMGVKWMGFSQSDIGKSYSLANLQGMIEWIEGVSTILEIEDNSEISDELISLFDGYLLKEQNSIPDEKIQIKAIEFDRIQNSAESLNKLNQEDLILITGNDSLKLSSENKPILKKISEHNSLILGFDINLNTIDWIDKEIRPGYKTFDDLADILEFLEED